jgi:type I restriction-modification system DNA methylase subunit
MDARAATAAKPALETTGKEARGMTADHLKGIEKFEADLWKIADNLRANSNLASNEYFMPIMGLIFLRHATNRFYAAKAAIEADKAAGKMPDRPLVDADFTRRRALNLPASARFDVILKTPKDSNLGVALNAAMEAIEAAFLPLAGQLPKDYARFEGSVLEEMMRTFDSEGLRTASGDVFGRIYEYFLAEFSKQGAHDNGEFFTPPSIVQTIVNVIEPDHGIILDPACGSGGMFVQSSHFIEDAGQDTMKPTRTVPCQLWFFDRAKEKDDTRRNHVLMLDARNIFRKVSRSVCDFSPEQQKNIAAIVWLYRGQSERFLKLVESYLAQAITEGEAAGGPLAAFEEALGKLIAMIEPFAKLKRENDSLAEPWVELTGARATLTADVAGFGREAAEQPRGRSPVATTPGSTRRALPCIPWQTTAAI